MVCFTIMARDLFPDADSWPRLRLSPSRPPWRGARTYRSAWNSIRCATSSSRIHGHRPRGRQNGLPVRGVLLALLRVETRLRKQVRKLLDDLGIRCLSTHNGPSSFTAEGLGHAIELNQIIGSQFIVLASAGDIRTLDGWKGVATRSTRPPKR